jgi:hypothetical protein
MASRGSPECRGKRIRRESRYYVMRVKSLESTWSQWHSSAVNVPITIERVIQLLEEDPAHHTIGPLHKGDDNVMTVTTTRTCMYLPFRYMIMVLGQDLTAREACLLLLPAIVNDGLQQSCRELVDLLVVGVTKTATAIEGTRLVLPRLGLRDF